jgi:hypothetical protein
MSIKDAINEIERLEPQQDPSWPENPVMVRSDYGEFVRLSEVHSVLDSLLPSYE